MTTNVVNIGSSSTVVGGTVTLTVTGVPAGAHTVVSASWNATATAGSVTDTAGNTYLISSPAGATQPNNNSGALGAGAFFRQRTGLALNNGDTIVFTLPATATLAVVDACYVTGLAATGADTASFYASAFGNSTTPSVQSGFPLAAGEVAFAMVTGSSLITGFTQDTTNAAWGTSPPAGSISNAAPVLGVGVVVNNGTGKLTYAPTFSSSDSWAATIVGFLPAVFETNTTAGRFNPTQQYTRFRYNHGCELSGAQPGSEPSLVVLTYDTPRPSAVASSSLYYHAAALDVSAAAATVETNPHFIGRFKPATYSWLRFQQQGSEAAVVAETNPHFISRYRQEQRYGRFGYQNQASEAATAAVVAETNVSFIGRYRQEQRYSRFAYQGLATDPAVAVVVETNPHFVGKFRPVAYPVPTYLSVCEANSAQPGAPSSLTVITYDVPRPSVVVTMARYYFSESLDVSVLQAETPTHFLARFKQAPYARFSYNHGCDVSGPIGPQPESNTHFVPPFTGVSYRSFRFNSWDVSGASTAQPETNVSFIGKFQPVRYTRFSFNFTGSDGSGPPGAQPETNVHFVGRFRPAVHTRFAYNFNGCDLSGPPPGQPETNIHTIGRFKPVQLTVSQQFRSNIAADLTQPQSETNVHFLARFRQIVYNRFSYNLNSCDISAPPPPQPETNVHFLAKFSPVAYSRFSYNVQDHDAPVSETNTHFLARYRPAQLGSLIGQRSNVAADFSQPQPETNVNTIGTFRRPPVTLLQSLWNNQADDTQIIVPETNTHFLGRFQPTTTRRFAYNFGSEQGPPPAIQPDTAVSFIGRFVDRKYAVVPMYMFQNSRMTPSPLQPDAAQASSIGVYQAFAWSQ